MLTILLVDDEPAITESLAYALDRAGFRSVTAATLGAAEHHMNDESIALVVLDIMLPDGNGLDWLRTMRAMTHVPVIILSSHDETIDHIVGLELGADDYVSKPFSPREVVARIRAVLRRMNATADVPPNDAAIRIDDQKRQAWAEGAALALSRIEFEILRLFAKYPGRVFERDQILSQVWGPDVAVTERTVDVHVKSLRKKLVNAGLSAETIETVRGVGYRLAEHS